MERSADLMVHGRDEAFSSASLNQHLVSFTSLLFHLLGVIDVDDISTATDLSVVDAHIHTDIVPVVFTIVVNTTVELCFVQAFLIVGIKSLEHFHPLFTGFYPVRDTIASPVIPHLRAGSSDGKFEQLLVEYLLFQLLVHQHAASSLLDESTHRIDK